MGRTRVRFPLGTTWKAQQSQGVAGLFFCPRFFMCSRYAPPASLAGAAEASPRASQNEPLCSTHESQEDSKGDQDLQEGKDLHRDQDLQAPHLPWTNSRQGKAPDQEVFRCQPYFEAGEPAEHRLHLGQKPGEAPGRSHSRIDVAGLRRFQLARMRSRGSTLRLRYQRPPVCQLPSGFRGGCPIPL